MLTFLMVLFVILAALLAFIILLQQGKGDMGLGGMGGGSQMLFGGSGGQDFFERITWAMGLMFVFGALGLAVLNSRQHQASELKGYTSRQKATPAQDSRLDTSTTTPAKEESAE